MDVDKPEDFDISTNSAPSDEDMFADCQEGNHSSTNPAELTECSKAEQSTSTCNSLNEETTWRGTPLHKLLQNTCKNQFPPVIASPRHSVLFKLPVRVGLVPTPWPDKPRDVWDQNHVRMPHSASSLYPVTSTELRKRWDLVEQALSTTINTSHQLQAAILHYNSKYSDRWDFQALHSFFSETLEEVETNFFFGEVLPKVVELALKLPTLVTGGVPLLRQHVTHSISLTQQQISCLLANAFLCTFPRRNTSKKNSEYSTFPDINFNRLFNGDGADAAGRSTSLQEKLKCLINYFRRVTTKVPDGVVTYSRHYVPPEKLPMWSKESVRLTNLYISSEGTIEEMGTGMLQMDFANKYVGGGVLGRGCVQEEIRFVICPELILARLFTEVLDNTEAFIVTGCEQFSIYRGYADSFEWAGNKVDSTPQDSFGRRYCTLVAIDAFQFPNAKTQYSAANINRELNKAYAGFSWGVSSGSRESVATGNWGCGAFRGDACLKSLLQLMAAAKAGRDLAYFTFGNEQLRDRLAKMHSFLVTRQVTVGDLWRLISSYSPALHSHSLYAHIYRAVNTNSIPSPMPATFLASKKPRVEENKKSSGERCQERNQVTNGRLSAEEIQKALQSEEALREDSDSHEGVKPTEAKTLSVQKDKELCLKRLSSSWTNLNESKRDFGSSECTTTEQSSESELWKNGDIFSKSSSSSRQTSLANRKKKISDYFHTVPKS